MASAELGMGERAARLGPISHTGVCMAGFIEVYTQLAPRDSAGKPSNNPLHSVLPVTSSYCKRKDLP